MLDFSRSLILYPTFVGFWTLKNKNLQFQNDELPDESLLNWFVLNYLVDGTYTRTVYNSWGIVCAVQRFQQFADKLFTFCPRLHFSISRTSVPCGKTVCRQSGLPCIWHNGSLFSVCKIWIQFSNERSLCWTFIFPVELLYRCLVNRLFSTLGVIYLDISSLQNVGGKCLPAGGAPHASDLKIDWLLLPKMRVSK